MYPTYPFKPLYSTYPFTLYIPAPPPLPLYDPVTTYPSKPLYSLHPTRLSHSKVDLPLTLLRPGLYSTYPFIHLLPLSSPCTLPSYHLKPPPLLFPFEVPVSPPPSYPLKPLCPLGFGPVKHDICGMF